VRRGKEVKGGGGGEEKAAGRKGSSCYGEPLLSVYGRLRELLGPATLAKPNYFRG
jgi:hypothetical protein